MKHQILYCLSLYTYTWKNTLSDPTAGKFLLPFKNRCFFFRVVSTHRIIQIQMPRGKKPKLYPVVEAESSTTSPIDFILLLPLPVVQHIKTFLFLRDKLNWKFVCKQWLAVYRSTLRSISMRTPVSSTPTVSNQTAGNSQ